MKKHILTALMFILPLTAFCQRRISEYPNTTSPDLKFMFILADTNSVPATNHNYTFGSLSNFIYSLTSVFTNSTVAAGSNVTVLTNLVGSRLVYTVSSTGGGTSLSGSTNFVNLSVQAAKLPGTNFPGIDASYQNWELVYYKTNEEGAVSPLNATWQLVVPPDYATNSLKVRLLSTLVSTNGPNTSNTVFRVSLLRASPGDSTDLHVGTFGAQVSGTNTWTASTSNTNKVQSVTIDMGTNSLVQAGDLILLQVDRNATNDTYGGATALVGLQLEYTRP